jgi:acetylornithine deacetylase/succinyl-diaminopimelate desuccinylase-like protein
MIGEIPSPTFAEENRARFIKDRFNESGVQDYSSDEENNTMAIIPGTAEQSESILLVSHLDTVFSEQVDHSITVLPDRIAGPGLADNSVGVAALVSLPALLESMDLRLRHNLILLGASQGLGRGNLRGVRLFLQNNHIPTLAGVCVEGVRLGRLNSASIGMLRGEFTCTVPEAYDWSRFEAAGAIVILNEIINRILEIRLPRRPRSSIVFGSIQGGTGYSVIPTHSSLRFEIRSESARMVEDIRHSFHDITEEVAAQTAAEVRVDIFAERDPGGIHYSHPLVQRSRDVLQALDIEPRRGPSTSELAALIDHGIPAITIGLTTCEHLNEPDEIVQIEPLFTGLAQLIGILLAIDGGFCHEPR